MQRSKTRQTNPLLDETFGVGTFYRLIDFQGDGARSLHIVGDGTIACSAITFWHCDFAQNIDGTSLDPNENNSTPGWGLGPSTAGGSGAATTIGASDLRLWIQDTVIGTLTIAAATDATGAARVTYSNQPARFTKVKIVVSNGGRLRIAGAGGWSG